MRCPLKRRATVVIVALALWGCYERPTASPTSPKYDPISFRVDITRLISAKQYRQAVALVKAADVDRQLAADGAGYMAIGEDMILLPGVYPQVEYDASRDWYVPGTQDAIQDSEWQKVATNFAERYNLRRRGMDE